MTVKRKSPRPGGFQSKAFPRPSTRKRPGPRRSQPSIESSLHKTVKLAAKMGGIALLIQSAPVLLVGIAGCVLVFQSCSWSLPSIAPTTVPTVALHPQPQPSVAPRPAYVPEQVASFTPEPLPVPQQPQPQSRSRQEQSPPRPRARQTALERLSPRLNSGASEQEEPDEEPDDYDGPRPAFNQAPQGMFGGGMGFPLPTMTNGPGLGMGGGFFGSPNPMWSTLVDPMTANQPQSFEESPLFDLRRGRKFLGTSQLQSEPSRRISLSLDAIRERGTNITARLTTIEGTRFSRQYTGVLENNPPRLTLIPVQDPRGIGTFVTYQSWTSNSPTRISLTISNDGKELSGSSYSGEVFELLPAPDRTEVAETLESDFSGFDDKETSATIWFLDKRNYKTIQHESWEFHQKDDDGGQFAWLQTSGARIKGSYTQDLEQGHLDIEIVINGEPQLYHGYFKPLASGDGRMQVCIPKSAAGKRPNRISVQQGNVFDLIPSEQKVNKS